MSDALAREVREELAKLRKVVGDYMDGERRDLRAMLAFFLGDAQASHWRKNALAGFEQRLACGGIRGGCRDCALHKRAAALAGLNMADDVFDKPTEEGS